MAKFKSARPLPTEVLELPAEFTTLISQALEKEGLRITQAEKIADAILRMSDFYIENPQAPTPWEQSWVRVAQWVYYLPLNYLRSLRMVQKAQEQKFFAGISEFIELGPGLGAATAALSPHIQQGRVFEIDSEALEGFHFVKRAAPQLLSADIDTLPLAVLKDPIENDSSLGLFSYSLTELDELPPWVNDCEALMILEPSTQQDGRRLQAIRSDLIGRGFSIWAPCTHQTSCPLLQHSKKDWCHDRLHWNMPEWFATIDRLLPIRNQTLTLSYLLARKAPPTDRSARQARVTGDMLHEKGKSRSLVCFNDERLYLSWLHKKSKGLDLARGDLIEIPENSVRKGNELRIHQ